MEQLARIIWSFFCETKSDRLHILIRHFDYSLVVAHTRTEKTSQNETNSQTNWTSPLCVCTNAKRCCLKCKMCTHTPPILYHMNMCANSNSYFRHVLFVFCFAIPSLTSELAVRSFSEQMLVTLWSSWRTIQHSKYVHVPMCGTIHRTTSPRGQLHQIQNLTSLIKSHTIGKISQIL